MGQVNRENKNPRGRSSSSALCHRHDPSATATAAAIRRKSAANRGETRDICLASRFPAQPPQVLSLIAVVNYCLTLPKLLSNHFPAAPPDLCTPGGKDEQLPALGAWSHSVDVAQKDKVLEAERLLLVCFHLFCQRAAKLCRQSEAEKPGAPSWARCTSPPAACTLLLGV